MIEKENGQRLIPQQSARKRISPDCWEQIKTAYASGIGLCEIARNMGIPVGTILSRAKRERLDATDSASRGVSFLQVNDSEAQAEIFYGPFYGRARF